VALSFQAARLQLMRAASILEVASAAGFSHRDKERVTAALGVVGWIPRWASAVSISSAAARCAAWCWPGYSRVRPGR